MFNFFYLFYLLMKIIIFIIILIVLILIYKYIYNKIYINEILKLDLKYFTKKIYKKIIGKNILDKKMNTKEINNINKENNKDLILIISCDNRPELEYVRLHNSSFEKYTYIHPNIDYKFYTDCGKENVYWSRLFMIRNLMMQNKYKWIGWVDSDTIIIDYTFNLNELLNGVTNKDIIIADDNQLITEGINSGIFFIKNSEIGFNFITDTINKYKLNVKCRDQDNKLNGMFAGICYEQAQMELQIETKYKDNTYIIPTNIVLCTKNKTYSDSLFIYHLIATKTKKRNIIFKKIDNINN